MSFGKYMRLSMPEAMLCLLTSTALCICILDGFVWSEKLLDPFVPVILAGAIITILGCAFSFRRKTIVMGVLLLCVFIAGGIAVLSAGTTGEYGLFCALICLTPVCVFLLSRTRIGTALLFAGGVLVITGSTFLEYGNRPACLIIFLVAGACLLVSRLYRIGMLHASTFAPKTARMALLGLVLCIMAAVLSAGVYFSVVKPLEPPTQELKLITELKKLPLLEKLGVASTIHIIDHEQYAAAKEEEKLMSDTQDDEQPDISDKEEEREAEEDSVSSTVEKPGRADAVSYEFKVYIWLYIAAGLIVVILAAVGGKLLCRRRRFVKLLKRPQAEQVVQMYLYFIDLMVRCGLPPVASSTPVEYCDRIGRRADRFFSGQDDFHRITQVFERVYYGAEEPSPEEYDLFLRAYRAFPSKCAKSVNLLKRPLIFFAA